VWWKALSIGLLAIVVAGVAGAQGLDEETDPIFGADARTKLDRAKADLELKRAVAAPVVTQAGVIDPKAYILGPGDGLEIDLWGRIVRAIPLEVSPEGKVFVPGKGPLDVGGQTLEWARDRIQRQISELYVGVRSDVRLTRLRTFKIYLTGLVKIPGAIEVNSATRASEAIAAIGLMPDASRRNIQVRHLDGRVHRLDLDAFELAGRQDRNPRLIDGDVISVPRARNYVNIDGAVARPANYELADGDSLSTLMELAGGLLPAAAPERALMVRFSSATDHDSIWVDLASGAQDMPLQDGDRMFVLFRPEYHRLPSVGVFGEVERPGTYPITPGRDRLTDLVRWANGFRPDANRAALFLLRETASTSERDAEFERLVRLSRNEMTESEYARLETMLAERRNGFRVDWNRLQQGSTDIDPLLQDGDVLRVDKLVPSVRVEGQVKRPGFVDYAPGRTVSEYVQMAGGFTERSARSSVRVSRGFTGQIVPARSLRVVQPGDFIWVPDRRDVDAWAVFRDIVTVAGQMAVIIFTLGR
jgi:protein involved in polysaccharide export with SLBB domain